MRCIWCRITLNSSLKVTVDTTEEAECLKSNHYNYYCSYSSSRPEFTCFETGEVIYFVGDKANRKNLRWLDTAFNQIWLVNECRIALMNTLLNEKVIPFNALGISKITSTLSRPINKAIDNGVIAKGMGITEKQADEINSLVGKDISQIIYDNGYYVYVETSTDDAKISQDVYNQRQDRNLANVYLLYSDGSAIQTLTLINNIIL